MTIGIAELCNRIADMPEDTDEQIQAKEDLREEYLLFLKIEELQSILDWEYPQLGERFSGAINTIRQRMKGPLGLR